MNKSYYLRPSPLGSPLLDLLCVETRVECIEAIEWCEKYRGFKFSDLQVIKYLWRLGVKSPDIRSDCDKILDYIDRAIANGSVVTDTLHKVRAEVVRLQLANDL